MAQSTLIKRPDKMACVYEEDLWKGQHTPPHILPHTHMHSQLDMTQTSCVHEGGHVERQVCLSTHPPSCTHARQVRDDTDSMCV